MRLANTIIVLLLTAAIFCGCSVQKAASSYHTSDSVRVEIRYKEIVKRDTIYVELPAQSAVKETRDTTSHLETKYAISDAKIDKDGILHHSLETKNTPIALPAETKTIVRDSIIYRDREAQVKEAELVERELTAWQKWQMRSFWILLSVIAAGLIWHYRKPIWSFILRIATFL